MAYHGSDSSHRDYYTTKCVFARRLMSCKLSSSTAQHNTRHAKLCRTLQNLDMCHDLNQRCPPLPRGFTHSLFVQTLTRSHKCEILQRTTCATLFLHPSVSFFTLFRFQNRTLSMTHIFLASFLTHILAFTLFDGIPWVR